MYRLKNAIRIFWYVLTHKYYWFFSIKDFRDGGRVGGSQFNSDEVAKDGYYSALFRKSALTFIEEHMEGGMGNEYGPYRGVSYKRIHK